MNGSCAGGTGAFIDEIATLLNVPADEFEQLAARGKTVYSISGRCGVFAKTDIQPLLIQGGGAGGYRAFHLPRHRQADHRRPVPGTGADGPHHL